MLISINDNYLKFIENSQNYSKLNQAKNAVYRNAIGSQKPQVVDIR